MIIQNTNAKNPSELHDYLIDHDCTPILLAHNALYDETGEKLTEATEISIIVETEKESLCSQLVSEFL